MPDERDIVEMGGHGRVEGRDQADHARGAGRPWLSLWFECAGQYARAYKQADGAAYSGRCPQCGASVRFPVGDGGTSERFFRVRC